MALDWTSARCSTARRTSASASGAFQAWPASGAGRTATSSSASHGAAGRAGHRWLGNTDLAFGERMTAISRRLTRRASWLALGLAACGGRAASHGAEPATPVRVVPLSRAIVLETAGPPPHDTVVAFTTGQRRVILLSH